MQTVITGKPHDPLDELRPLPLPEFEEHGAFVRLRRHGPEERPDRIADLVLGRTGTAPPAADLRGCRDAAVQTTDPGGE